MNTVTVKNIYTSIGCNRTPSACDWGENGLIIYGACNSIAILNPKLNNSSKILKTYTKHKDRVNCVKWIKNGNTGEVEFVSGSDDKKCIVWNISDESNVQIWVLDEHTAGITGVDGIYNNEILTIVTASTDSSIKLWHKNMITNKFESFQTIQLKTGFSFAVKLSMLPETNRILLGFSTDDNKLKLYLESSNNEKRKFDYADELIGHEDWIRGLDFIINDDNELMIATSSQDTLIRLWKIYQIKEKTKNELTLADINLEIEQKLFKFRLMSGEILTYSISLESVLQSHDGWVYGVNWNQNKDTREIKLLSSSIDKTLIIWSSTESGIWEEMIKVGDIGGNSLGFYGGKFSPNSKSIIGYGYQGSLHIWHQNDENKKNGGWQPGVISGGHGNSVNDLAWESNGEYLLTVSSDQTTRVHAEWKQNNNETWHEIARPQIHGYDIQSIALLTRYKFASGAEEKIIRSFQAPINFVENFINLCNINVDEDIEGKLILKSSQKGASVPSLGLSNKAVCDIELQKNDKEIDFYFSPVHLDKPPFEENLMQNTLWPEIQKLYGHGNDIFTICSTSDGKLIASACKASTAEHAEIILWNCSTWKQIQQLGGHNLTVTQMKFSPNNQLLLSVSRDRKWCLYENKQQLTDDKETSCNYQLIQILEKKNIHSRIIWTCDWSHDSKLFITGSRDGKAIAWKKDNLTNLYDVMTQLQLKNESITSLAFSYNYLNDNEDNYLVAVGLENGKIQLYSLTTTDWILLHTIDDCYSHHLTVRKLSFRPIKNKIHLASCGNDHLVRINEINF